MLNNRIFIELEDKNLSVLLGSLYDSIERNRIRIVALYKFEERMQENIDEVTTEANLLNDDVKELDTIISQIYEKLKNIRYEEFVNPYLIYPYLNKSLFLNEMESLVSETSYEDYPTQKNENSEDNLLSDGLIIQNTYKNNLGENNVFKN